MFKTKKSKTTDTSHRESVARQVGEYELRKAEGMFEEAKEAAEKVFMA